MKRYAFVDFATQGYIALVALLVLLFHGERVPAWPWLLLAHGIGLILIHGLIQVYARFPTNKPLDLVRHYYPIPLFIAFYRETELLNQMFHTGYLDPHFLRLEYWLFGMQPGLDLMPRFPATWLAEVLYAAYFSYYLMIAGVGLTLLLRDRRQFAHFIAVVSFMFYVCYVTYIFVPVVGPRIVYRGLVEQPLPQEVLPVSDFDPPASVQSALFFRIMGWIYSHFEAAGAAFPSSHVAVAICTLYFSFLYLRKIRHVHLTVLIFMCISTVYGRYHYVVDVAAGVLTAAILIPLGNRLYFKFANRDGVSLGQVAPETTGKQPGSFPD
jgi:membrane-associated phospholipid phosphatase